MNIVCYNNGACGDLICRLLDPVDFNFDATRGIVQPINDRIQFKMLSSSDFEWCDQQILLLSKKYKCIGSHHWGYHNDRKHSCIIIDDRDELSSRWAVSRVQKIFRNESWTHDSWNTSIQRKIRDFDLLNPMSNKVIKLRDILNGRLIEILNTWFPDHYDQDFYKQWLQINLKLYPWKRI